MDPHTAHERLTATTPLLLDGGLSSTLMDLGHELTDALWSARLLLDDPAAITAVHRAFLAAGAEVLTTSSYQLAAASLAATGREPALAGPLLTASVQLAREAIDDHLGVGDGTTRPRPLVAASIGAYGAVVADGSEYRGGYAIGHDELAAFHAPRIDTAIAAGADLLACETIPSGTEVAALAHVLAGRGVAAWISMTLGPDGRTTPEGQPLADAFAPVADVDEVVAIGVNCCPPELVSPALEQLTPLGPPLVVYPNVGARWDAEHREWVRRTDPLTGAPDEVHVGPDVDLDGWLAAGVRLVGGCCGTTPDDIARLRVALDTRTPT